MICNDISLGSTIYVKLSSWYDINDIREAKKTYPNIESKLVVGEVLAINDEKDEIFLSFPALLCCCWRKSIYLNERYVYSRMPKGSKYSLFSLAEFLAAERT